MIICTPRFSSCDAQAAKVYCRWQHQRVYGLRRTRRLNGVCSATSADDQQPGVPVIQLQPDIQELTSLLKQKDADMKEMVKYCQQLQAQKHEQKEKYFQQMYADMKEKEKNFQQMYADMKEKDADMKEMVKYSQQLQAQNAELHRRVAHAKQANLRALARTGALDARGAMEAIFRDLDGPKDQRWAEEVKNNSQLQKCLEQAMEGASYEDCGKYIQKELYGRLCDLIHGRMTASQFNVTAGGDIIVPGLPPKDRALLRCILKTFNYPVSEE